MKREENRQRYLKAENFLYAELDPLNSTFKMLMYREGFAHPNTYYSKKKDFDEPQDKEYLLLSMIERFIGRNNCFYRKPEQQNGKTYSPATLLEFWRIFEDDSQERLVLRLFHPTRNSLSFQVFDYLENHLKLKQKLSMYYELLRVGKTEAIGGSKPKRLQQDEKQDFFWEYVSEEKFNQHIAHLYAKYASKGRIDIYQKAYYQRHYRQANQALSFVSSIAPTYGSIPKQINTISAKEAWAKCLECICTQVESTAFQTWFLPIIPLKLQHKTLVIQVPSIFCYEWIESHYVSVLRNALDSVLGEDSLLEYQIA